MFGLTRVIRHRFSYNQNDETRSRNSLMYMGKHHTWRFILLDTQELCMCICVCIKHTYTYILIYTKHICIYAWVKAILGAAIALDTQALYLCIYMDICI